MKDRLYWVLIGFGYGLETGGIVVPGTRGDILLACAFASFLACLLLAFAERRAVHDCKRTS